jgi:putative ABC transport system permease protein
VTGITIALFASSILATQQRGLSDGAIGQLGSDIRISGGHVSNADLDRLRGLAGVADLAVVASIGGVGVAGHAENFAMVVVDSRQLAAVESDLSPQKHRFPLLGSERDGHPVAYGGGFLQPLEARSALKGALSLTVSAVEDDDPAPKFVSNSPWVLIDADAVTAAERALALQDSVLIRVTPGSDPSALMHDIRRIVGPRPLIASALTQVGDLMESPLVTGLTRVALAAIAMSLLFSVLALLLTLLMNAPARAGLLARVRALGFARRQTVGLIGWELGPMSVLGALVGAVLGVLVAVLFLSVVDLAAFVGGTSGPVLSIDPLLAVGSVVVFLVVAAMAVLVTAIAATGSPSSARRNRELDPS